MLQKKGRKLAQLERFSSDAKKRGRLFGRSKDILKTTYGYPPVLQSSIYSAVIRSKVGKRRRVIKFSENEGMQKKHIDFMLSRYRRLVKSEEISCKHYVFGPNPYLFAKGHLGLMRDLGQQSIAKIYRALMLPTDERAKYRKRFPEFGAFIQKTGLTKEQVKKIADELISDLGIISTISDANMENFYITKIDSKGRAVVIVTDQL